MTPDRRAWSAGRALLSTIVAVTVLLLAACSSDDGPPPPCPIVVLVKDADRLTRFEGSGRDLTDVVFETTIRNADVACAYDDNDVEAALRVLFATTRGPADTARRADFRYFVAVADREQNILAREEFDLAAIFPGNRTEILQIDEIDPTIPLREGESGADYVVYIGLVLSRDEVDYNRRTAR